MSTSLVRFGSEYDLTWVRVGIGYDVRVDTASAIACKRITEQPPKYTEQLDDVVIPVRRNLVRCMSESQPFRQFSRVENE